VTGQRVMLTLPLFSLISSHLKITACSLNAADLKQYKPVKRKWIYC